MYSNVYYDYFLQHMHEKCLCLEVCVQLCMTGEQILNCIIGICTKKEISSIVLLLLLAAGGVRCKRRNGP